MPASLPLIPARASPATREACKASGAARAIEEPALTERVLQLNCSGPQLREIAQGAVVLCVKDGNEKKDRGKRRSENREYLRTLALRVGQ